MELRSGHRLPSPQQQPPPGGGAVDRIGALPDDLLLLVLAHLRCARLAARTSVLSRRWRGLWACLLQISSATSRSSRLKRRSAASTLQQFPSWKSASPTTTGTAPTPPASDLCCAPLRGSRRRSSPSPSVGQLNGRRAIDVDLSCFCRATSIELESCLLLLRVPAGIEFPALETLSLSGSVPDLDPLLSCCPRLRTLRLRSIEDDRGELSVSSASLHELVVDRWSKRTHRVNIVAPLLKQLTMSFAALGVSISVLAPMLENVSWDCWYYSFDREPSAFGVWSLDQLMLQTAERQGHLPSLEIWVYAVGLNWWKETTIGLISPISLLIIMEIVNNRSI